MDNENYYTAEVATSRMHVGETGAIWDRGNVGHRTFLHVPIVLKN